MYDLAFINGVVKSRERYLLGEKLERMADGTLQDALRILRESSFGGETAVDAQPDAELLIRSEEESVNAFVREYAPDARTRAFLLAEYDFHNAEALVKCRYAGQDESRILTAEGNIELSRLREAVNGEGYDGIPPAMAEAIRSTSASFEEGKANGFSVDCTFKAATFEYLLTQAKNSKLKAILQAKADAANVSSALRSRDWQQAEKMLVKGGKLPVSHVKALCELSFDAIEGGDFSEQVKLAAREAGRGAPLTEYEKKTENFAMELLMLTRYDMIGIEPFVLYVLRRRAEIRNVRIITVSLAAGLSSQQIRNKIRLY